MANNNNGKKKGNLDPMSNMSSAAREGMRIMRNIAFGNFNFYKEGHVFRNLDLCQAIISECDKRLIDATVHVNAINIAYGNYISQDPNVMAVLMRDNKSVEAYNQIKQVMGMIINSCGDTRFLYILIQVLPKYKYNI